MFKKMKKGLSLKRIRQLAETGKGQILASKLLKKGLSLKRSDLPAIRLRRSRWQAGAMGKGQTLRRKVFLSLIIATIIIIASAFIFSDTILASLGFFSTDSLNKGLVGHWPLDGAHYNDDPTSYRVDDISGYGNHGTNSGATLTNGVKGESNGAMDFNGDTNYIDVDMALNDSEGSISMWIRPTHDADSRPDEEVVYSDGATGGANSHSMRARNCCGNPYDIIYYVYPSDCDSYTCALGVEWENPDWTAGQWHHIVTVWKSSPNESYIKFYSDNILRGQDVVAGYEQINHPNTFRIGTATGSAGHDGSISDVRIYNRALSENEIKRLYESYKPKLTTGSLNQKKVLDMPLRPSTEKVGNELLTNGDMEGGFTGGVADGWASTRGTPVDETTDVHSGSHAQKINNPAGLTGVVNQGVAGITGKIYEVTFWAKKYKGSGGYVYDASASHYFDQIFVDQDVFTKYTRNFVHNGVNLNLAFYATTDAVGDTNGIIFDDVSVKPLHTADTTPNSNHGAIYGADIRNHGASFDGTSNYINLGNNLDIGTSDNFSLSFWTKTSASGGYFLAKRTSGTGYEFAMDSSGYVSWYISDGSNVAYDTADSVTINNGSWHHVIFVLDRTNNKIYRYVDGANTGTNGDISLVGDLSNSVDLGVGARLKSPPDNYFNGQISDVLIYNRALSATEILDLYQGKEVSGAVLDMPLSDKTGFKDISGNGNHGTNYGATIIGEAASFDGTDDYVSIADSVSLDVTDPLSVSVWLNSKDLTVYNEVFNKADAASSNTVMYRMYHDTSGNLFFGISNGSANIKSPGYALSANTWYHAVGIADGNHIYLYVDGISRGTPTIQSISVSTNNAALHIGRWGPGGTYYPFDGYISDVQIYNRALSEPEIKSLYAKGRSTAVSAGITTGSLNKGLILDMPLKSTSKKTGSNLVSNSSFETGASTGWSKGGSSTDVVTTQSHSGSYAMRMYNMSGWDWRAMTYAIANPSDYIGRKLAFSFWMRGDSTNFLNTDYNTGSPHFGTNADTYTWSTTNGSYADGFTSARMQSNTWYQYSGSLVVPAETNSLYLSIPIWMGKDPNSYTTPFTGIYVDDVVVKEIKSADNTPNSNHGTIYGATVHDNYTTFDGTDDNIEIPSISIENNRQFTISGWVNHTGGTETVFTYVSSGCGAGGWYGGLYTWGSPGGFYFRAGDGTNAANLFSGLNLGVSGWHYLTITRNSSTWKVYANGVLKGTTTNSAIGDINYSCFKIGNRETGDWDPEFTGSIANIKIYNRALSANEVKSLFDKERSQFGI